MHSYTYVETDSERLRMDHPIVEKPYLLGELAAAKALVAETMGAMDAASDAAYRMGQPGEDAVDVYADNHLRDMRWNMAVESHIRALGILAGVERKVKIADRG
jgi:hypothetical protein